MLKKPIAYKDYNGVDRVENFYFNLNKAELMKMELGVTGGFRQLIETIMNKQDIPKIMDAFEQIILSAYGEKSPDGRMFRKSKELSEAFAQTEAYSNLYMELLSDGKKAAEFINALLPEEFREVPKEESAAPAPANEGDANLSSSTPTT